MNDNLGDRIKEYEDCYRIKLPRRSYVIMRIDGKAFHSYTKGLERPFDSGLIEDMQKTTLKLCESVQGCKFAYCQSDEISLILTDFDDIGTQSWFDNNLQKMASISASIATSEFNNLRLQRATRHYVDCGELISDFRWANFDSRIFSIASRTEVLNYLLWRQQDASRNSVSMVAQSLYSHNQLQGKSHNEKQEMIFQKSGKNWNDFPVHLKRGAGFWKKQETLTGAEGESFIRGRWMTDLDIPIFSQNWRWFDDKIPVLT